MQISRFLLVLLALVLTSSTDVNQDSIKHKPGQGFNSVFQKIKTGEFAGTVNGLMIIKNEVNRETLLDFQGSSSSLTIMPDPKQIYDVSTKIYTGKTTSGKTEIEYKTYGKANAFSVKIFDSVFDISLFDGGYIKVIDGLDYQYEAENDMEYLVLHVSNELTLSNRNFLFRNEPDKSNASLEKLRKMEKKIRIMPNSALIFAVNR